MYFQNKKNDNFELIHELKAALFNGGIAKQKGHSNPIGYEIIPSNTAGQPNDLRQPVSNSEIAPYRYICQIERELGNNKFKRGTGFFVGPKTILTAAHVVWDDVNGKVMPNNKVWIRPARNDDTDNNTFGKFRPSKIILSYGRFKVSDKGTFKDYAIIHLNENIGSTTGYFGKGRWDKDNIGSKIFDSCVLPYPISSLTFNVCGYPGDKDNRQYNRQYRSSDLGVGLDLNGRLLFIKNDTWDGMSGSPVWMKRHPMHGGRVVAGILLGAGPKDSRTGKYLSNVAVLITDVVRKFIKNNYK